MSNAGVLVYIYLQVKKVFIFAADGLTVETFCLTGKNSLENFMNLE